MKKKFRSSKNVVSVFIAMIFIIFSIMFIITGMMIFASETTDESLKLQMVNSNTTGSTTTVNPLWGEKSHISTVTTMPASEPVSTTPVGIILQMYNKNTKETSNTISPTFKLYNTGEIPINLEDLKIRYFYTVNGEMTQNFWCDWSSIGSSSITNSFVKMPIAMIGADYYIDIGFNQSAGLLNPDDSIELQNRIAKSDLSDYDQSDDYSFNNTDKDYTDWTMAAVYLENRLIWGTEPAEVAPVIQPVTSVELKVNNKKDNEDSKKLNPRYVLYNTGNTLIDLKDVKIRYYYTIDGDKDQKYWCEWPGSGTNNIIGRFVKLDNPFEKADYFFETSFIAEAGFLDPEKSIEIHNQIAKTDRSDYDQTNDYSYSGDKDYFVWDKVSVLIDNEWVWGDKILFGKPMGIHIEPFENSIRLLWTQVEGATGYDIECNNQIVGTVSDTSFEHSGLNAGTVYNYKIRAKSRALTGDWCDTISTLTLSAVPREISSTSSEDGILIGWNASVGADTYDIEVDGTLIPNVQSPYMSNGFQSGTEHVYRLRANNSSGIGNWSDEIKIWTLPSVITGIQTFATQDVIAISWNDTQGASHYDIEFDGQLFECDVFAFTMTDLLPGTEHFFRVRAANDSGAGQWSDIVSYWTVPDIVKVVSSKATTTDIIISWDEVIGATAYDIEADGQIIEDQSNPYTHLILTPGTRHIYRIRAKNSSGLGIWSDSVTVWTIPDKVEGLVLHPKETEIMVEWEPVTGASGYDLEVDSILMQDVQQPYNHIGLLPGTSHVYRVRAKNSSGVGEWSETVNTRTIPGIVQNLNTQATEDSIEIECYPVEGADTYDIEVDGILLENVTFPYIFKGLSSGTVHKYRVRAANSSGTGRWNDEIIVWTLPAVPENIEQVAEETFITIQWDNVTGAVSYDIEANGEIISDTDNPYVNTGLLSGTKHVYRIRAKNSSGVGKWSEEYIKWTLPGIVTDMESNATQNDVSISWAQVTGAEGYEISLDGTIVENATSPYKYINLLPGTMHKIAIRAVNSSGRGKWNEEYIVWTLPDVPENILATATVDSIVLKWDDTTGATGYEVEILNAPVNTGGVGAYTHSGLNPNTQYTYRIRATNSSGAGEWSDIIAKTTQPGVPIVMNTYTTDKSIRLEWNAISGATGYDVEVDGEIIFNVKESAYDHTDLYSNSSHKYKVRSRNNENAGDWSSEVHAVTLMAAPENLTSESSIDKIGIKWDEVQDATGYDIEVDGKVLSNGTQTSYTHSGLSADTEHIYRVRAQNGDLQGVWSSYIYSNTLFSAPENITISVESTVINIKWDLLLGASGYDVEVDGDIIDNGLSGTYTRTGFKPLTEHKIRVRARSRSGVGAWSEYKTVITLVGTPSGITAVSQQKQINVSWEPVQGATGYELMVDGNTIDVGTQYEHVQAGLEPNTMHFFKIRAKSGDVFGSWSEIYSSKTLIGTPANLEISAESSKITISWDEVAGAESYDIETDGTVINNNVNLYFIHAQLEPNTVHKYRVRARSNSDIGEWSDLAAVGTTIGVPKNIKVQASTSSIILIWDPTDGAEGYDLEVDGSIIKDIISNTFTHSDLNQNTRHKYRIRSKNNTSVSEWSSLIIQNTTPEITIPLKMDNMFNFVIVIPPAKGASDRMVIVNYNPKELDVFDLCAVTAEPETEIGQIIGTNISVEEFSPGKIVYKITGSKKTTVNIIKFISKIVGNSKVTYIIK